MHMSCACACICRYARAEKLSGGERRRLQMLQVLAAPARMRRAATLALAATDRKTRGCRPRCTRLQAGMHVAAGRAAHGCRLGCTWLQAALHTVTGRAVVWLQVLARQPNVLLLDEPTNDLDLQTLAALEDFACEFEGVLLCVRRIRLQPPLHTVAASAPYGCSLHHTRLKPPSHMVAASMPHGRR